MSEPHADLTFRTLEPGDEGADAALLRGWLEGLARGFHDGRNDQAEFDRWRRYAGRDGAVVRGAWPTARVADGTLPVGTFASWAGELNVGGGSTLGLHMISDVTVAPTHRRQGLLRRLMTEDLDHALAQGRPLAALTATEGSIYGRFGFGPAVRGRRVEIDTGSRFGLRDLDDPGSLEMVEPAEAWPYVREVFDRHLQRTRGAVSRPAFYEMFLTGEHDWDKGAPDKMLRAVATPSSSTTATTARTRRSSWSTSPPTPRPATCGCGASSPTSTSSRRSVGAAARCSARSTSRWSTRGS